MLHSDFTSDDEDVQRFIRAMTTVVGLHHPNLIALYGAGKQGATCWFAMEYVDGEPLTKLIEKFGTLKMLDWQFALTVGVHIAQALEAAHEKHIIHRNVSPESILIRTKDKAAKLGDMMLAKAMEGIKAKQITKPGELVGNIAYMAPERTRSDVEVDTRADIYGLGATLYALLTGKPPFEGKNLVETIAQIRQADPVPPKKFQLSIPDKFQDAVMLMLAKRPELRTRPPPRPPASSSGSPSIQGMVVYGIHRGSGFEERQDWSLRPPQQASASVNPHEHDAPIRDRRDRAVGMGRVGGEGLDLRPAQLRQLVEWVERLTIGLEHGQTLAAQPEPAPAVAGQVRHIPSARVQRRRGDLAAVERGRTQSAVGRQQQLALRPRDRLADLESLVQTGFGHRDDR